MQTLLAALKKPPTKEELNILINTIAFIRKPHPNFINEIEDLIDRKVEGTDRLLLSYGALAQNVDDNLQQQIVTFLTDKLEGANNLSTTVHLLFSLGNTGSEWMIETVVQYLNHSEIDVRVAVISALRMQTNSQLVQNAFTAVLTSFDDSTLTEAIIKSLVAGQEHLVHSSQVATPNLSLLHAVVTAALKLNSDHSLHCMLVEYLKDLETPEASELAEMVKERISVAQHFRNKRVAHWDEANSVYDLVSPIGTRRADVINYPQHRAYIIGKTFGARFLNVQFAGGVFLGASEHCDNLKAFGGGSGKVTIFGETGTIFAVELSMVKTGNSLNSRAYIQLAGTTLVDEPRIQTLESNFAYNNPLQSTRLLLLRVTYTIHIYVAKLCFTVDAHAQVNTDLSLSLQATGSLRNLLSARASITPNALLTIGGRATTDLVGRND